MGEKAAVIGDVDGDGIVDLAVHVLSRDDGASAAGAVLILFMRQNGTVKANQMISATEGGASFSATINGAFGSSPFSFS